MPPVRVTGAALVHLEITRTRLLQEGGVIPVTLEATCTPVALALPASRLPCGTYRFMKELSVDPERVSALLPVLMTFTLATPPLVLPMKPLKAPPPCTEWSHH